MSGLEALLGTSTAWTGFRGGSRTLENRFALLRERVELLNLEPDCVHLAAEIAALEPDLNEEDRIALVLLILASLAAIREGSTRLPLSAADGGRTLEKFLTALCPGSDAGPSPAESRERIEALLRARSAGRVIGSSDEEYKPLLQLSAFLYHQRGDFTESRLAKRLADFLRATPDRLEGDQEAALREVLESENFLRGRAFRFTEDQKSAVRAAIGSCMTIITGGPGTGKTSIVVAILRVLIRLGVDPESIALAAPTGKAADRMGESVRAGLEGGPDRRQEGEAFSALQPRTLHRLLGYLPRSDSFLHHPNNPLEQSFVLVDEGSMVDLELMDRLVAALRPGTRLVLLGDANQLPSVSAGAVFRDLLPEAWSGEGVFVSRSSFACVRLAHNFRMEAGHPQGRAILSLSEAINRGDVDFSASKDGEALVAHRECPQDLAWSKVEHLDEDRQTLAGFLDEWEARHAGEDPEIRSLSAKVYRCRSGEFDPEARRDLDTLFERLGRARILCVTRVFRTGSRKINQRMHARAALRARKDPDVSPFLPGEPIMMLHNDYALSLWNGDQGVLLRVGEDGSDDLRAVFRRGGGYGAFHLEALRGNIELSYAMTVHKAQGSEFDEVALILPEQDIPLLSREILYTALTRSRKSVLVIGGREMFAKGIARKIERSSGLSEKLRALLERPIPPTPARSASRRPRRTSGSGS
jgi:exodeoxyribonuclease V alpha subunit